MPDSKLKEKERTAQLKALREELENQIEEDLAANPPSFEIQAATLAVAQPGDLSEKRILEALLFASSKPLTAHEIRKVVTGMSAKQIETLVQELRSEYEREERSFELIEIAGGFQIVTRKVYSTWLAKLEFQKKLKQASRSALETLAILAYKQPVTRAEIEELRGVDISGVLSTLLERGFVKIAGKKEVAGRPFLYGTTEKFLEHFGLKSLADLPQIGEIKNMVERAVKRENLIEEGSKQEAESSEQAAEGGEESKEETGNAAE